jgi:hypothetical protein
MDIESKKIKSPFSPSEDYFVDLANRIQQRVGIEVLDVVNREKEINFNEKQKPLQLTVEFGYPLKAQKQPKKYESPLEVVNDNVSEQIAPMQVEMLSELPNNQIITQNQESTIEVPNIEETSYIPQEEENTLLQELANNELLGIEAAKIQEVLVSDPTEVVLETEDLKIEIAPIHMELEPVYYNEAELDALHEVLSSELNGTGATLELNKTVTAETESPAFNIEQNNVVNSEMLEEPSFSDAELDALHEQHEQQINSQRLAQEQIIYQTRLDGESQQDKLNKAGIWQMIPWSSVFGMVASLMAVASAWLIWNSIQKPLPIDEYIDRTMVTKADPSAVPAIIEDGNQGIDLSTLSVSDRVVYSDVVEEEIPQVKNFDFKKMSEQSKISSVELERVGLTVLDLEDELFDDIEI